ncbi:MAG TPA: DUF6338 family protein [Candidatus Limnocylindria bacterium]|nr:DUF6338 family protein [Candidatus Limnocylindria bacterium]
MALAWSTVALLVLLLPGFVFFLGLSIPERFSRDTTPRSPVGQLAGIVLVSLFVHLILLVLNGLLSRVGPLPLVDLRLVLDALQVGGSRSSLTAELGTNLRANILWFGFYVGCSVIGGLATGFFTASLAIRQRAKPFKVLNPSLGFLLEHGWVYDLQSHPRKVLAATYAYLLVKLGDETKCIIYRGPLHRFGLNKDGTFAFLVLLEAERSCMDMSSGKTILEGAPTKVGRSQSNATDLGELEKLDYLYVSGNEIANAYFARLPMPIQPVDEQAAMTAIEEFVESEGAPETTEPEESK